MSNRDVRRVGHKRQRSSTTPANTLELNGVTLKSHHNDTILQSQHMFVPRGGREGGGEIIVTSTSSNLVKKHGRYCTRQIEYFCPPYLNPFVWIRHGLSLPDIERLIYQFSSMNLWHLGILLQLTVSRGACKHSYSARDAKTYGSQRPIRNKIVAFLKKSQWGGGGGGQQQVSSTPHHVLPHYQLLPHEYNVFSHSVPSEYSAKSAFLANTLVTAAKSKSMFKWKNIRIVPQYQLPDGRILMCRVIPTRKYQAASLSFFEPSRVVTAAAAAEKSFLSTPMRVIYRKQTFTLTGENFYISPVMAPPESESNLY